MRKVFFLIPALLLAAVSQAAAAEKPPTREMIERDLALKLSPPGTKTITPGGEFEVTMTLVNKSKDKSYTVVMPGDGSAAGWREPYVHFSATLTPPVGKSKSVPAAPIGRCGNFDNNWEKDTRVIKPGEEVLLDRWVPRPFEELDFQQAGHVKLKAHFSYRAGVGTLGRKAGSTVAGAMAGVPAFELVSEPVEFAVVKPMELQLKAKKELAVKAEAPISEILELKLLNTSDKDQEIFTPYVVFRNVSFELEGSNLGWRPATHGLQDQAPVKLTLKPGEAISLFDKGAGAANVGGTWTYPTQETVKIRASCYLNGGTLRSEWVEVKVK